MAEQNDGENANVAGKSELRKQGNDLWRVTCYVRKTGSLKWERREVSDVPSSEVPATVARLYAAP